MGSGHSPSEPVATPSRALWEGKSASWVRWADPIAGMAEKFNLPFLTDIGVENGHRVLDLASGAGEPAMTAAQLVGPDGLVVATDFAVDMLSGIRKRRPVGRKEVQMDLVAADMQNLPFEDASFDRISCRFGIMFVPDTALVAEECFRVLNKTGVCGFMTWGQEKDQTLFSILTKCVSEQFGLQEDGHYREIFRFAEKNSLADFFRQAGFSRIEEKQIPQSSYVSPDRPFWQAQLDMTYGHLLADRHAGELKSLDERIRQSFMELIPDGQDKIRLDSVRNIMIARKQPI